MHTVSDLIRVRDSAGRIHHVSRADLEDVDRIRFQIPLRTTEGTAFADLPRWHALRANGTTIHRESIAERLDD